MNLFDAPAWAEALLGNKVKFPSFGTAQASQAEVSKTPYGGPGLSLAEQSDAAMLNAAAPRKKPGPKPGSKRKVKE